MTQEFKNLLDLLESPNKENVALALQVAKNYKEELYSTFYCDIPMLKSALKQKEVIGNISLQRCLLMTEKEKIIRKTLSAIKVKIEKINAILNAKPHIEIILIQNETRDLIKSYQQENPKRTPQEMVDMLEMFEKQNDAQWKIIKKQNKSPIFFSKKCSLEFEKSELESELFYFDKR